MNFKELVDSFKKQYFEDPNHRGSRMLWTTFLADWTSALDDGCTNWQDLPLLPQGAESIYQTATDILQFVGMRHSSKDSDDPVWPILTRMLDALRIVLVQTYKVYLPEARVVSPVTEVIEAGLVTSTQETDGKILIGLPIQLNLFA